MNAAAPAPALQWTEEPPTVPGWYWQRKAAMRDRIVDITPDVFLRPRGLEHWRDYRARLIADSETAELQRQLAALPVDSFLVQWAGPLVPPV